MMTNEGCEGRYAFQEIDEDSRSAAKSIDKSLLALGAWIFAFGNLCHDVRR